MRKYFKKLICLSLLFALIFASAGSYTANAATKPLTPKITQSIKVQTDKNVKITISDWGSVAKKEYKINNGAWQKYTVPFEISNNSTIYARGTSKSGVASNIASLTVTNIRKLMDKTEVSKRSSSVVKIMCYDINGNEMGNGSGFFISKDGKVVTNYHVIDMIPKLKVITSDDKSYDVVGVLAYDTKKDLAVLKIDAKGNPNFPAVVLGNSDTLKLGEDIVAIGYPKGLKVTVSFGNVSSLNVQGGLLRIDQKDIQISAPISEGSSGGPLLNMYGEVVGINYSTIINAQNINYSIPANELKPMLNANNLKGLSEIIREVYPKMDNTQCEDYLYYNYPDYIDSNYKFGISNLYTIKPSDAPNEIDVYVDMNTSFYGQVLLAEMEGNKKVVEDWIAGIYKSFKDINPEKDVYVVVGLSAYFNERPSGYTDSEAVFDYKENKWDVYRIKMVYGYENNTLDVRWY